MVIEERITKAIGLLVAKEPFPQKHDARLERDKFTKPRDPPLVIRKQGT